MTTWANPNGKIVCREFLGRSRSETHRIVGISGDTGGTLTAHGFKVIDNYSVQIQIATGPAGYNTNLTHYITGKTIVVAYDDPVDDHTVRIKLWGPQ
jgi:hypothetical protein